MLISRLNGVAWYHDAQTISQQCEMQVICLVVETFLGGFGQINQT
jgi:hypothetical protein